MAQFHKARNFLLSTFITRQRQPQSLHVIQIQMRNRKAIRPIWCLRQACKSTFGLAWLLTSWSSKFIVSYFAPRTTYANLHQDRFELRSFSKYRVHGFVNSCRRTNWQVENVWLRPLVRSGGGIKYNIY